MKIWLLAVVLVVAHQAAAVSRATLKRIPLSQDDESRLERRYGKTYPALKAFHSQWKDPKTYTNIVDKMRPQRRTQDPQLGPTATPAPPGFILTKNQQSWFDSLLNDDADSQTRAKRALRERREYRQLSCREREAFHRALRSMKNRMIDGMSEYDIFVGYHQPVQSPFAHGGAAFLPWHREYLFRFENALRRHNPRVTLPYWDSTLDGQLPSPHDSIIWSDQFLGDGNGTVETGPFKNWTTIAACQQVGRLMVRNVGGRDPEALYKEEDIEWVLSKTSFKDLHVPAPQFEWSHGGPHVYTGGHMGMVTCSPTDPIFWMHHAFVDYVWEVFRTKSQKTDRVNEYPTHSTDVNIGGEGHNPDAPMYPFKDKQGKDLINKHGLKDHFTSRHYTYAPRPKDCVYHKDCGRYLFCRRGRCRPKVKLGGDCTGLLSSGPIFKDRSVICECGMCLAVSKGSKEHRCKPLFRFLCRNLGCRYGR